MATNKPTSGFDWEAWEKRKSLGSKEELMTAAAQQAGYNPAARAYAMFKASRKYKKLEKQLEAKKKGQSTMGGRVLRMLGQKKTAMWYDRFLGDAAKEEKTGSGRVGSARASMGGAGGMSASGLRAINSKLDTIASAVADMQGDVTDIKSLIMPKGIVARNKKGEAKFVQFNPMAPQGEQFQVITESGKLSPIKLSKETLSDASKKAALETAKLAIKINEKDKERGELRAKGKKFEEKKEPSMRERKDHVGKALQELKDEQNKHFKSLAKKLGSKGEFYMSLVVLGGFLIYKLSMWIKEHVIDPIMNKLEEWKTNIKKFFTEDIPNMFRDMLQPIKDGIDKIKGWFGMEGEKKQVEAISTASQADKWQADFQRGIEENDRIARDGTKPVDDRLAAMKARDDLLARKPQFDQDIKDYRSGKKKTGELRKDGYEDRVKRLGDIISRGESGGDYNAYNRGKAGDATQPIDFSKMTIAEYLRRGSLPANDPDKILAVGKYQIIPKTMRGAVDHLGLDPNTTYLTPETQEKIFREYLVGANKRPKLDAYLKGKSDDVDAAVMDVAKEWAAVGVPHDTVNPDTGQTIKKGESYYKGSGGNAASIKPEEIASALKPVTTIPAGNVDGPSRSLSASNSPSNVTVIAPQHTTNKTASNNQPNRPLPKATAQNEDPSFLRNASRDVLHPTLA